MWKERIDTKQTRERICALLNKNFRDNDIRLCLNITQQKKEPDKTTERRG